MEAEKHKIAPTHDGLRKLKATVGDSKKRAKAVQAIARFGKELDKLKGSHFDIQSCVIHGAFARGTGRFQQVDMLLVLAQEVDEVDAFDFIIDNIFCDIYLDTGIYFYIAVMTMHFPRQINRHRNQQLKQAATQHRENSCTKTVHSHC